MEWSVTGSARGRRRSEFAWRWSATRPGAEAHRGTRTKTRGNGRRDWISSVVPTYTAGKQSVIWSKCVRSTYFYGDGRVHGTGGVARRLSSGEAGGKGRPDGSAAPRVKPPTTLRASSTEPHASCGARLPPHISRNALRQPMVRKRRVPKRH